MQLEYIVYLLKQSMRNDANKHAQIKTRDRLTKKRFITVKQHFFKCFIKKSHIGSPSIKDYIKFMALSFYSLFWQSTWLNYS